MTKKILNALKISAVISFWVCVLTIIAGIWTFPEDPSFLVRIFLSSIVWGIVCMVVAIPEQYDFYY